MDVVGCCWVEALRPSQQFFSHVGTENIMDVQQSIKINSIGFVMQWLISHMLIFIVSIMHYYMHLIEEILY